MIAFPMKRLRHKIIAIMLVATGFLALLNIAIQAYVDYQQEMEQAENNTLRQVRSLYFPISEALWDLDLRQLEQLLISISKDDSIQNIQLKGIEGTMLEANVTEPLSVQTHQYDLRYNGRMLGTLSYQIDDSKIQEEVLSRLALGFLLNTLEALLIIAIVVVVVYSLVTKPLNELYAISKTINPQTSSKLKLPNSLTQRQDELSYVAKALQNLNNASRRAIAAQRRTERQLLHHQNQLEQSIEIQTKAYKTQSKLHQILADMSLNILTCSEDNMATVMYRAFEPIGRLLDIDRLSVLTIDDNIAHYRYSWRADGSENPYFEGFNIGSMALLQRRLLSLEPIVISDIELLKTQADSEYNMMKKLGIDSVAIFPLIDGKAIFGLLIAPTSAAHTTGVTRNAPF
ncbi:hypothetical protein [Vibrio variabilis]|uniref:hypothetical protein n=1 Tax=Vibrio variabilis TaxID=990271 RepID=UPI0013A69670|nr:hypothetical protein [Vibrio variabilis]